MNPGSHKDTIAEYTVPSRFRDKIAVVTGGAGGIGSAVCRRLAGEGAYVVIVDRDETEARKLSQIIGRAGGRSLAFPLDLSSPEAGRNLAEALTPKLGRIDVLINNAGINRRGRLTDLGEDDWRASFAVNVDAMYQLCRAIVPLMVANGRGSIVNTASQWGLYPAPGHIAYTTSKAAVVAFSRSLARDYASEGIRVNAVCPGEIQTPMLESGLARSGRTVEDLGKEVPFGRIGQPKEVAALVAFLASDEAPFITGSIVEIAGAQGVA